MTKGFRFFHLLALIVPVGLAAAAPASADAALDLTVKIRTIKKPVGHLIYTLYSSRESYEGKENEDLQDKVLATRGTLELTLHGLKPGFYAFTVYQDENDNGEFDVNWLHQPTELFGLSNVTRRLWSEPDWEELKFEVKAGQKNEIPILLKYQ